MKLKDKVAIVTGAGRNIGEQIAKLFASEGAKIVIVDMDKGRGQHVVDDLKKDRHEAILSVCNVIKTSEVQELVKKTVEHFGGIDILVNNAAITDHKTILTISEEEFDQVIAVTLKGPFLVAKHVSARP